MKLSLINADITTIAADAIVNAANTSLLGGGGVDGAIHRKGGKAILEDCLKIRARQGGCDTGQAVITTAGNLPARHVIHTAGPVWSGNNDEEKTLLRDCYVNSLKLAVANGIRTIAFPNISTGIYHFPKDAAAAIAIEAVSNFEQSDALEEVIFVCYDDENFGIYQKLLRDE